MMFDLWDRLDEGGAILVPWKTGIMWNNQVGGVLCAHPKIEGFLVPFACYVPYKDNPLAEYYDEYEPDRVAAFLKAAGLEWAFLPLTAEEAKEAGFHQQLYEAWVPVRVRAQPMPSSIWDGPISRGSPVMELAGQIVILTHANSD